MQVKWSPDPDATITLVLRSDEVPVFRATLERASFVDTRPEVQSAVIDFVSAILQELPED